jgi:hypothetical protein
MSEIGLDIKQDELVEWIDSVYWDLCGGTVASVNDQIIRVLCGDRTETFRLQQVTRNRAGKLIIVGSGLPYEAELLGR